jgi:pyruvate dehydrogenase E2 component (dihydrolipoamide acetyltransferase)
MARTFTLPDLGEGLTEGEIARWLVEEGQEIAEDDPLVEIQTDKATVDIPSPYEGTVLRIVAAEGEVVPVGSVLVVIGEPGETIPDVGEPGEEVPAASESGPSDKVSQGRPAPPGAATAVQVGERGEQRAAPSAPRRVQATPVVRRIAQELGVDLAEVTATGPGGRITEEDVRAVVTAGGTPPAGRREPLRGVRRLIAEHMTRAHREVPPVTWVEECDFEAVDLDRLVATVVKASVESLPEYPELNARLEGDEIVYLDRYDIGVAVQTEQGLVVPVVRDADALGIEELDAEIRRLADGARTATLRPEEVRGSTFTVTSAGKLAGLFQTPIVNHPEVAILSVGRIAPRPVVRDGEIVVRRTGTIAVTFDHRVVDGARAAEFGLAVVGRLEAR